MLPLLLVLLALTASTPAVASSGSSTAVVDLVVGEAPRFAVVGGAPAAEGAWPSVVALVRAEDPDDVTGQFCAGTAVAPDLVLTAAHCVHSRAGDITRTGDQIRVVAGRQDLSAEGGVEVLGTEIYVHPDYDARRHRNDLAILRVGHDLGVPGQSLAGAGQAGPFEDEKATVVGWGRTEAATEDIWRPTDVLHEATVRVSGDARCRGAFDGTTDLRVQMCAGGDGPAEAPAPDTCTGDSGGPLLVKAPGGDHVQVGITSFGPVPCGVDEPGVFTRLTALRTFVDEVVAGDVGASILPGTPVATGQGEATAVRIADPTAAVTEPVGQAVVASRAVFGEGRAELAVIARDDGFADALAGSALGYGRGPLLFTSSTGALDPLTRAELERAVQPGATVYLLGGTAALPARVEDALTDMGFVPQRLAGASRESTAAAVAQEVVARHGGGALPFDTAVLVTAAEWPDAVLAGQLGAWWGFPILLTPADSLHPATADALATLGVARLLVVGGRGAVAEEVVAHVLDRVPDLVVERLAGADRVGTGIAVAGWHRAELDRLGEPEPDAVVAVNVRRADGYAHVLGATPILGATAGVLLPVDGEGGDVLGVEVVAAYCGVGGLSLVVGGPDLISEDVAGRLPSVLDGSGC